MVAANSVQARLENSRVIPRIIPSSASVNGRPQNARPSPIVTGIASDLLHAGSHAYVTGIFRESPENSSPRTSRMYKLQGQALPPANQSLLRERSLPPLRLPPRQSLRLADDLLAHLPGVDGHLRAFTSHARAQAAVGLVELRFRRVARLARLLVILV